MFRAVSLSDSDVRLLLSVAHWTCSAPHSAVEAARAAFVARKEAAFAFSRGEPAVPAGERCSQLRAACDALARNVLGRRPGAESAMQLLVGPEHGIPMALCEVLKKILISSIVDPSAEEISIAASEAGRAVVSLRAKTGAVPRATAFVICLALYAIRDELAEPNGRLNFDALRLIYDIARRAFEEDNTAQSIARGRVAARLFRSAESPYVLLLAYEEEMLQKK